MRTCLLLAGSALLMTLATATQAATSSLAARATTPAHLPAFQLLCRDGEMAEPAISHGDGFLHFYNEKLPLKPLGPDHYQASAKAIVVDIKQESDGRFSGQWTLKSGESSGPCTPVPVDAKYNPQAAGV